MERDAKGKFLPGNGALGKQIALRLPRDMYVWFESEAARRGMDSAKLARAIVLEWKEEQVEKV